MVSFSWIRFLVTVAYRNLRRSPRRTLFSLLAIAGAAASLLLFRAFVDGVSARFRFNIIASGAGHYQLYRKGFRDNQSERPYDYPIQETSALRQAIESKVGPLIMFAPRQEFFGLIGHADHSISARGIGIDATEEERFLKVNRVERGHHLAGSPEASVFLGDGLAKQLHVNPGDTLTLLTSTAKGSINAADVDVVGTFKTGIIEADKSIFYVHLPLALKLLRIQGPSEIVLGFPGDNELRYGAGLRALIKDRFPNLEVLHWHELAGELFDGTMGWLESIFSVFKWVMVVVLTLGILNVFSITLLERLGEFGTLRAMGTYRSELLSLILTESLLQSVIGGIVGIVFGALLICLGLRHGISMPPPSSMSLPFLVKLSIPWSSVSGILALCVVIAVASGILPTFRVLRTGIVQALGRNV